MTKFKRFVTFFNLGILIISIQSCLELFTSARRFNLKTNSPQNVGSVLNNGSYNSDKLDTSNSSAIICIQRKGDCGKSVARERFSRKNSALAFGIKKRNEDTISSLESNTSDHNNFKNNEVCDSSNINFPKCGDYFKKNNQALQLISNALDRISSNPVKAVLSVGSITLGSFLYFLSRNQYEKYVNKQYIREETPLTKIFGHILLSNVNNPESGIREIKKLSTADFFSNKTDSIIAIYFSSAAVENALKDNGYMTFTPKLKEIYRRCHLQNKNFEVVYIPVDKDSKLSEKHFSKMPWVAIPHKDKDLILNIISRFELASLPSIVLINSSGKVLNKKAYTRLLTSPDDYPWGKRDNSELIGSTFFDNKYNETVPVSEFDNKVIGLYFGASWCKACKEFNPILKNAYENAKKTGKNFEIIYISNDQNQEAFNNHVSSEMNYCYSIPFNDTSRKLQLQDEFEVRTLPKLVILDENRQVVNTNACNAIRSDMLNHEKFPWPQPLTSDIDEEFSSITEKPSVIVFLDHLKPSEQDYYSEMLKKVALGFQNEGNALNSVNFLVSKNNSPRSLAIKRLCRIPNFTDSSNLKLNSKKKFFYRHFNKNFGNSDIYAHKDRPLIIVLSLSQKGFALYDESTMDTNDSLPNDQKSDSQEYHSQKISPMTEESLKQFVQNYKDGKVNIRKIDFKI